MQSEAPQPPVYLPLAEEWEDESAPDYSNFSLIDEAVPANVPLWREAFCGLDFIKLRASPVYYGIGVPRGDGSAVIVIPGFMGSDVYLTEFRWWLRRMGYRAYQSKIGRNWDCLEISGAKIKETVDRAYAKTGRKVHLVGHSLGGIIARAVATLYPEKIASVTTLGSPFRAVSAHPLVLMMGDLVRDRVHRRVRKQTGKINTGCFTGKCTCGMVKAARKFIPETLPQMSVYSKTDGVVDWRVCYNNTDPQSRCVEVKGTHCGLAFNAEVYKEVARFLKAATEHEDEAEPEEELAASS